MPIAKQTLRALPSVFITFTVLVSVVYPEPANGSRPFELPFELYRDYIIVAEGSIGTLGQRNLLIDTGAVPSVLDSRLAKMLKLKGKREPLWSFTGTTSGKRVRLSDLQLGPIRLPKLDVLVQDLRFIERRLGVRIDAMIGLDVLGWSNFAIDFHARKLLFGVELPKKPTLPFEVGPGKMLLTVEILGEPFRLVIDTGTPAVMLFDDRFRKRFPSLQTKHRREFENLGGGTSLDEVELPELRIGTIDLSSTRAVLIPTDRHQNTGFDGLLGVKILGVSRLYFDHQQQLLSWSSCVKPCP